MSTTLNETADQYCQALLRDAENLRREKPTLDAYPIQPTPDKNPVSDYSTSGQVMESALGHLRESVPNGQRNRTVAAFKALELAVVQQKEWLLRKGYDV